MGIGEAQFMVNPLELVHRPQSRSMKDLVHLLLPRVWFMCTTWLWSELGGAARDVVVLEARRSYSGCGHRGHGRSSVELLKTWSTWLADGSVWLAFILGWMGTR